MTGDWLAGVRNAALWTITAMVALADLVSFAESYRGLLRWGEMHRLWIVWAAIFPLMIDVFIIVGELTVFVLVIEQARERTRKTEGFVHKAWHRAPGWGLALLGLAGSVAGNVGDVWTAPWSTRITHGVPPVAAALALAVGLGVLKRIAAGRAKQRPTSEPATATPPPARTRRKRGTEPAGFDQAVTAYRISLTNGQPYSARQLARDYLDGNRYSAARAIATASNGHATAGDRVE